MCRKWDIHLTQLRKVGSTSWGGRPRPLGGPRLRFQEPDEASGAVQGDRPTNQSPYRYLSQVDTHV